MNQDNELLLYRQIDLFTVCAPNATVLSSDDFEAEQSLEIHIWFGGQSVRDLALHNFTCLLDLTVELISQGSW